MTLPPNGKTMNVYLQVQKFFWTFSFEQLCQNRSYKDPVLWWKHFPPRQQVVNEPCDATAKSEKEVYHSWTFKWCQGVDVYETLRVIFEFVLEINLGFVHEKKNPETIWAWGAKIPMQNIFTLHVPGQEYIIYTWQGKGIRMSLGRMFKFLDPCTLQYIFNHKNNQDIYGICETGSPSRQNHKKYISNWVNEWYEWNIHGKTVLSFLNKVLHEIALFSSTGTRVP